MTRLSWCVIHDSGWQDDGCFAAEVAGHGNPIDCQMVEMELHPAGSRVVTAETLVIEKVDGEWPEWASEITIPPDPVNHPTRRSTDLKPLYVVFDGRRILDALAQSKEEE